jgi:hypothetical protein
MNSLHPSLPFAIMNAFSSSLGINTPTASRYIQSLCPYHKGISEVNKHFPVTLTPSLKATSISSPGKELRWYYYSVLNNRLSLQVWCMVFQIFFNFFSSLFWYCHFHPNSNW